MEPDPYAHPPDDAFRDRIGAEYPKLRRMIAAHVHKTCDPKHVEMFIDEVVQETICEALKSGTRYDVSRPVIPWLMGFAINILLAKRRNHATDSKRFVHSGGSNDWVWETLASHRCDDGEHQEELEAVRGKVQAFISRLDVDAQKAIYFRFFEGLEGRELARAMDVEKPGTARVRVYRAVRKLKGLLISGARELVPTETLEREAP